MTHNNQPPESAELARRRAWSEAVAHKVKVGLEMAEMKQLLGGKFPHWLNEACGAPLPEAELLMRWSADRPMWADPAAVYLCDPPVWELLRLGRSRMFRQHLQNREAR